ncbi:MAG: ABC transporter permease [Gemmatimonadota bacterium]|nr:MAG: ABC transporter permease [Gemmatimonadota bacterium]
MLDSFKQDLGYALRTMRRNPGFAAVAVITLAFGIGANTAIFSLVNPYLFRPLPFREPGRLVHLFHVDRQIGFDQARFSLPQYADFKDGFAAFEDLGVYNYGRVSVAGRGEPESLVVGRLSANALNLLGVEPMLGRGFLPDEDRPGADRIVILSHGVWQRRYAGDREIIGQTITLDEAAHTVIGVMPPDFVFPYGGVKLWSALQVEPRSADRTDGNYLIVGRLKPGVPLQRARTEMETIHQRLSAEYPDVDGRFGVRAVPIRAGLLFYYDLIRGMLLFLMAAVGFVLLIVAANVGNIMLARATAREREVAIRSALGSGRWRLLRQFLTESATLAGFGAVLGVLLAIWVVGIIGPVMPEDLYRVGDAKVDGVALGFTVLLALAATIFFGLAPSLQASRVDVSASLKEGGRSTTGGRGKRLRSALVVSQIATTLVLLVGAVLAIQAFLQMQRVDPGFDLDRVLSMSIAPSRSKYPDHERRVSYQQEVMRQLEALPGVEAAGGVTYLPLDFSWSVVGFEIEGREPASPDEELFANENFVTAGYFAAMGIAVLRGRTFNEGDTQGAPRVVAINQTMAERFWPAASPIGRRVMLDPEEEDADWATVVTVVSDVKHRWLSDDVWPQVYTPQSQSSTRGLRVVVRAAGDPAAIAAGARQAIWSVDPGVPISGVRTMGEVAAQSLGPIQMVSGLLFLFGLLALLLACIGIYGVVAYSVNRRLNEFGLRMALGAETSDVLVLVLRHGALLAGLGIAIGLAVSAALTRLMSSALAGVAAPGIALLIVIAIPLAVAALAASYLPARRAARVDPVTALRSE